MSGLCARHFAENGTFLIWTGFAVPSLPLLHFLRVSYGAIDDMAVRYASTVDWLTPHSKLGVTPDAFLRYGMAFHVPPAYIRDTLDPSRLSSGLALV